MYHVVKFTINVDCFIAASTNNLALNKQATQSSDWSSSLAPHKAVDGDVNTYSCTVKESNNYWSVDLGMEAMIDHLYIKNIYALSGGGLFIWQTQTELHHHNIQDAILTHWDRDKITAIFQTTLSNVFSWMKCINSDWDVIDNCSKESNKQYSSIGSNNGEETSQCEVIFHCLN